MASVESVLNICSRYFDQNLCEDKKNRCQNCFKMLNYIKVLTTELKSVQLIIKILQEELKYNVDEYKIVENIPMFMNPKFQF